MNDSILNDIKKMLGLDGDYTPFDTDIIIGINSAIATLNQAGIGSPTFMITSADETWGDFLSGVENGNVISVLSIAKLYIYYKTKLVFDPPNNGSVTNAYEQQAEELLWRANFNSEYAT